MIAGRRRMLWTYEVDPIDVGMDLRKLGEVLALAGPNDLIEDTMRRRAHDCTCKRG